MTEVFAACGEKRAAEAGRGAKLAANTISTSVAAKKLGWRWRSNIFAVNSFSPSLNELSRREAFGAGEVGNLGNGNYTRFNSARNENINVEKSSPAASKSPPGASGFRFAIVASRWNDAIVSRLIQGAQEALDEGGAGPEAVRIFRVPGSFELPLCALKAAGSGEFDAIICLGVIIRGDTPHFDYIAAETTRGIGEAGLKTGVPVLFGVITADNVGQANERAGSRANNKGFEAAVAAVELANLYRNGFGGKRSV